MSHIIQSFGNWKALNEDSAPGSVTVRARMGQKVVLNPIDTRTLKIKIKNDADVLDASQKLTASGFKALVDFIKTQPTIIGYYPTLNDLVTNIVIYTTERDSPSTQVITFNIGSKTELGGSINSQVQYARQDELELIKKGTILNVPNAITATTTAATTLTLPIANSKISGSKDAKLIEFFKDAYLKIKKDTVAAANPIMAKVKAEIAGGALGENARLFTIGLNAGFGIKDWSGDDYEQAITKTLVDKLALVTSTSESTQTYLSLTGNRLVTEAVSATVTGFDPDLFNSEIIRAASVATGDIVVPAGGFKVGLKGDAELKKFQNLLLTKFGNSDGLIGDPVFDAFKAAGTMQGNYGPKTSALVAHLKTGLSKPKWNADGSLSDSGDIIEPEFVARIQAESGKVSESSTYLSLDGTTLISEELSGTLLATSKPAATATAATNSTTTQRSTTTQNRSTGGGKIYTTDKAPDREYAANPDKGYWATRLKGGSSSDWARAQKWTAIKDLMTRYPNAGAHYTIPSKSVGGIDGKQNYIYKPTSSGWQAATAGKSDWEKPAADSIAWLDSKYGKAADLAAGKTSTTTTATSTSFSGELTRTQQNKIAESIKAEFSSQLGETISFEGGNFEGIKFKLDLLNVPGLKLETEYQIGIDGKVSITVPDGDYDNAYTYSGRITSDLTGFKITNGSYGSDAISWKWSDLPKKQRFRNPNGSYLTGDKLTEAIKKAQEAMQGGGTWIPQTLNQVFKCKTKADWKNFNKQWNSANQYDFPQWMYDDGNSLCKSALRILAEAGVISAKDYRENRGSDSSAKPILIKYYK
jgi:hypothetical protein